MAIPTEIFYTDGLKSVVIIEVLLAV